MLFTTGLLETEDFGGIDLIQLYRKMAQHPTICNATSVNYLMPLEKSNQLWSDHPQ